MDSGKSRCGEHTEFSSLNCTRPPETTEEKKPNKRNTPLEIILSASPVSSLHVLVLLVLEDLGGGLGVVEELVDLLHLLPLHALLALHAAQQAGGGQQLQGVPQGGLGADLPQVGERVFARRDALRLSADLDDLRTKASQRMRTRFDVPPLLPPRRRDLTCFISCGVYSTVRMIMTRSSRSSGMP